MRLLAIGRLGNGPKSELFATYARRLRPALKVTEIADASGAPAEIRRREEEALLAAAPSGGFLIALDLGGVSLTSEAFAARLAAWLAEGQQPVFVIGGAEGLPAAVLERAGFVLSLGVMTWPHKLARVMLAEQLYRAQAIASGHPYHRAGRP